VRGAARKLEVVRNDPGAITYAVRQVPISRIRAFAFQPRKWFDPEEIDARAESMRELGQQDPVTVEPLEGDPEHDYELINGESRLRSARKAGLTTVWAAVRSRPFGSRVEKHLASLVANFNRSDHTPMEISDALFVQVTEGSKSQADVARALGRSGAWVSQFLSLQKLHPKLQELMHPARPKALRLATATALELAREPVDKQLQILAAATCEDGTINMLRRKVRQVKRGILPGDVGSGSPWSMERETRYRALHCPDPEHVKHLRAGIAEFRRLLERRH
jgi:ParB family chromosome partitioning protein